MNLGIKSGWLNDILTVPFLEIEEVFSLTGSILVSSCKSFWTFSVLLASYPSSKLSRCIFGSNTKVFPCHGILWARIWLTCCSFSAFSRISIIYSYSEASCDLVFSARVLAFPGVAFGGKRISPDLGPSSNVVVLSLKPSLDMGSFLTDIMPGLD